MRGLVLAVLAVLATSGACAGKTRPTVMPRLEQVPDDPQKRGEYLDAAGARPGPETKRKPLPGKLEQVETVAATAAALAGMIFSTTKTVVLGASSPVEEMDVLDPQRAARDRHARGQAGGAAPGGASGTPSSPSAGELVPWIDVRPPETAQPK